MSSARRFISAFASDRNSGSTKLSFSQSVGSILPSIKSRRNVCHRPRPAPGWAPRGVGRPRSISSRTICAMSMRCAPLTVPRSSQSASSASAMTFVQCLASLGPSARVTRSSTSRPTCSTAAAAVLGRMPVPTRISTAACSWVRPCSCLHHESGTKSTSPGSHIAAAPRTSASLGCLE